MLFSSADLLYQSLRTTYTGNACYMLKVNSAGNDANSNKFPNFTPDPWASSIDQESTYASFEVRLSSLSI